MAEENQVMKEPQGEASQAQQITKELQQITKEPQSEATQVQRVTTKNPKKVEAGKRLAESHHKKREVKKREQAKLEASRVNQYYGIGAVIALGYRWSWLLHLSNQESRATTTNNPKPHLQTQPQTNKFEMDYIFSIL